MNSSGIWKTRIMYLLKTKEFKYMGLKGIGKNYKVFFFNDGYSNRVVKGKNYKEVWEQIKEHNYDK